LTDKPVSPLRQRMIEDMTVRHFKEKVQKDYIRHVTNFKDFLGRSPDTATSEDLRLFSITYDEEPCWRSEHQIARSSRSGSFFQGDTRTA